MRSILAAADTVEHNVWVVAVGGDLGAQSHGAGHLARVVAHDGARRRLSHNLLLCCD